MALKEVKINHCHYYIDSAGRRQGEYTVFYSNGNISTSIFYIDDVINGHCKEWHKNGILATQYYCRNGMIDGLYQRWYEYGSLNQQCWYVEGTHHGEYKHWHKSGRLALHSLIINGREYHKKPYRISKKEKFLLTLQYGVQWL